MKTLMILGGSRYLVPVIDAAHRLGYRAVTCDYLPDNIGHRYSDDYRNVSIIDPDATLRTARELAADGVISFACDPGVVTAAYVAEAMGLPTCGPLESVRILQNKGRFRAFLKANGFNVPEAHSYTDIGAALADADSFRYPVLVKPVDSAGSKGISRAEGPGDLRRCAEYALPRSLSGAFIVEQFIEPLGIPSDSDGFSVDGRLAFMSFADQRLDPGAQNPYVPSIYSWPAEMPRPHRDALRADLQRLLTLLGMGTSLYNFETRVGPDGRAYIMECSPRGGGNRIAEGAELSTGAVLVENAVRAALGLELIPFEPWREERPVVAMVLHARHPGTFERLWVDPALEGAVVDRDLWIAPGATVGGFSGANEAIGTLMLRFDTLDAQRRMLEDPDRYVRVVTA